jgi:hypothetical protein
LPRSLTPARFGDVEVRREEGAERAFRGSGAAVTGGRVFSLRRGSDVEASLQVARFRSGVDGSDPRVRRSVLRALGGRAFRIERIGELRVYALDLPEQRLLVWFPPGGRYYELLVARATFDADGALAALIAHQRGEIAPPPPVPVPDPRRGEEP